MLCDINFQLQEKKRKFLNTYQKLKKKLTWSSGDGMSPADPEAATLRACHQLWSSLEIICRTSPVRKI